MLFRVNTVESDDRCLHAFSLSPRLCQLQVAVELLTARPVRGARQPLEPFRMRSRTDTSSCLMAIFHANTRDSQRSNLNLQNTRYSLTNIAEQIPLFFLHTLSDSVKCCRCCKCKCLKCSSTAILFFSTFAPLLSFI